MRSTPLIITLLASMAPIACDSPMIPGRDPSDIYEFALETQPPLVIRWPRGATIRVFVHDGPTPDRTALLDTAFDAAADAWNDVPLFAEFRFEQTTDLSRADVVLTWSDVLPPVATGACRPAVTQAVTTFCIRNIGTDSARFHTFPLAPPADPESSRVRIIVTVLAAEAANPQTVHRLVAHELGHVLGIARHSGDARDLMFRTDPAIAHPAPRDAATVQILYNVVADLEF